MPGEPLHNYSMLISKDERNDIEKPILQLRVVNDCAFASARRPAGAGDSDLLLFSLEGKLRPSYYTLGCRGKEPKEPSFGTVAKTGSRSTEVYPIRTEPRAPQTDVHYVYITATAIESKTATDVHLNIALWESEHGPTVKATKLRFSNEKDETLSNVAEDGTGWHCDMHPKHWGEATMACIISAIPYLSGRRSNGR